MEEMKEIRFFYVPEAENRTELPAEEAMHALRVLRLQAGDEMVLADGEGNFYRAEVTLAHTHHCCYEIKEKMPQERQWPGHVHLAIAPTKMMERMEWMIEKAVEIGVDEISFLNCQFSERRIVKMPRAMKIAVAALKQSRKAWMPLLHEVQPFADFISQPLPARKYIAHCYEEVARTYLYDELRKPSADEDAVVLIGPEGDFSIDEVRSAVANGWTSVHLGESRLRTETAGLAAIMMMQLSKK
jgi:16S rRNA (uracil1498-N3)-methyltransferase